MDFFTLGGKLLSVLYHSINTQADTYILYSYKQIMFTVHTVVLYKPDYQWARYLTKDWQLGGSWLMRIWNWKKDNQDRHWPGVPNLCWSWSLPLWRCACGERDMAHAQIREHVCVTVYACVRVFKLCVCVCAHVLQPSPNSRWPPPQGIKEGERVEGGRRWGRYQLCWMIWALPLTKADTV